MTSFRGPLLYSNPGHPFNRLPLDIVDQVGQSGAGGNTYYFTHMAPYNGPRGDAASGQGWIVSSAVGTASVEDRSGVEHGVIRLGIGGSGSEDNNAMLALDAPEVLYENGQYMWCFARIALSDVNDMEAFFGLGTFISDFVAGLPDDGIFFEKAETAVQWDFHVRQDGASNENTPAGFTSDTLTDAEFHTIGFLADRTGQVTPYFSRDSATFSAGTPFSTGVSNMPDSTTSIMVVEFGVETGASGDNDFMDIDWIFVVKER